MRQITCPVCKKSPSKSFLANQVCPCEGCHTVWTYLPEELDEAALYSDEVYAIVDNRNSIFERIIFREAKKILSKARQIIPDASRLLDFGAGKGQFLKIAKSENWEGIGIETATKRAEFGRKQYRVEILEGYYSHGQIQAGNFDLITLNHVLEHLPDPVGLLNRLLDANLAPGGICYIEVPRENSWQAKLAGKNWMHWDIPKHLTHWTEAGLLSQMELLGYRKVDDRRFSLHLGVLGMLHALMCFLGFRGNLILRLKRKRTIALGIFLGILLPFALVFELVSLLFNKSGIIGIYFKKNA